VPAQFFEWKLSQKNHITEESVSLILHNFVTTTEQLSNSRHYLLQLGQIDPTNNNLTKTPQLEKTTRSTEHHHPWTLREKGFVAMALFLGAAGVGAAPTVGVLGRQHSRRSYKWHSRDR
jgi:hypothetical protein